MGATKPMKFYTRSKIKGGSTTDELLLLASQKSEDNQGWYPVGYDNKNNETKESLCVSNIICICILLS